MHLWAEAARIAVYVQNRSPHRILGNKTPEEMFSGEKLEVSHLMIFGCPVYIHVPKEKRSKLEPSRRKDNSLAKVSHRKHSRFTFLVSSRLKLAEMLLSMRMQPSVDPTETVQKRFLMTKILYMMKLTKPLLMMKEN